MGIELRKKKSAASFCRFRRLAVDTPAGVSDGPG